MWSRALGEKNIYKKKTGLKREAKSFHKLEIQTYAKNETGMTEKYMKIKGSKAQILYKK